MFKIQPSNIDPVDIENALPKAGKVAKVEAKNYITYLVIKKTIYIIISAMASFFKNCFQTYTIISTSLKKIAFEKIYYIYTNVLYCKSPNCIHINTWHKL